jgi:sporulation protein YlmC with PRC-barrel domain
MTTLQLHLVPLEDGGVSLAHPDDDVRGMVVLDVHGRRVGEVEDIVVDEQERRARLLVVASGGVLGLGAQRRLVPVEAVARVSEHVRLHHSDLVVQDAGERDPRLLDASSWASLYEHYECIPFWEAEHVIPYFHDRRW